MQPDWLGITTSHQCFFFKILVLYSRGWIRYRGITAGNQFHSRGNPSTDNSVLAVYLSLWYYRKVHRQNRGTSWVTAVLPPSSLPCSSLR